MYIILSYYNDGSGTPCLKLTTDVTEALIHVADERGLTKDVIIYHVKNGKAELVYSNFDLPETEG